MKLLKSIVDISDAKAFFEALQDHKDALLDYEEDVQDVKKFFANQREIFDKAIKMLDIFEANRSYVLDKETLAIVAELDRITRLASPYSEIHKLPDLIEKFILLSIGNWRNLRGRAQRRETGWRGRDARGGV